MKGRSLLLVLPALVLALGCENSLQPIGPGVPNGLSKSLSDGAHGDNPDFFFLPPLLKLKKNDPNFELGAFNNTLRSSLKVVICELQPETSNPQGLPIDGTPCGATVKTFAPGDVQLVNLPIRPRDIPKEFHPEEWWKGPNRSPEGFYYVLWDTRQQGLNLDKFYRIKVLIAGSGTDFLLGFADVDPKAKGGPKWKYSRTRDVIEMVDNVKLPIPFRVENEGALCTGLTRCTSVIVTGENPDGSDDPQVVVVDGGAGAIAGASFPNGWLPAGGPQSVVVTIAEVPSGETAAPDRSRTTPCHAGLPFQQFNKCFKFTTTPTLAFIGEGVQFARDVTVAVCYVLEGTEDPREEFAELYSSGPNEPAHALEDVSDEGILGPGSRDCTVSNPIGLGNSNPLTRLASIGWRNFKGGLDRLFGVKTAYAVDVGLGGIVKRFSNIGPALTAEIQAYPNTEADPVELTLVSGTAIARARIMGSHEHGGEEPGAAAGINRVPVTFTVASGNGTLRLVSSDAGADSITVITSTFTITNQEISDPGVASVIWTPPTAPGTYTLTATGPATGGPVTFTATVPAPPPLNFIQLAATERRMLSMQTGASIPIKVVPDQFGTVWLSSDATKIQVSPIVTDGRFSRVTAIIGGENIAGGADASLTSVLITGNPGPSLLVNSFAFDIFPRTTTLVWNAVAGAVSYEVVTEFGNASATDPFCTVPADCGLWTVQVAGSTVTSSLTFTFDFVGSQPGRWRVFARNAAGVIISTSAYVYFDYDV